MLRVAVLFRRLLIRHSARIRAMRAKAPRVDPTAIAVVLMDFLLSVSGFAVADVVLAEWVAVPVLAAVLLP